MTRSNSPLIAIQTACDGLDRRMQAWNARVPTHMALAVVVGILGTLGSLFWFFTPTIIYHPPERIRDFAALCADPFTRDLTEPFLAYRILTPALAWALGLRGASGLALQYLALVGLLATVFALFRREAGNLPGLAAVAAIGSTFTVIWSSGYAGFPDSVSHACLALALLFRRPPAIAMALTLAGLNDERSFLAAPLIVLWHVYHRPDNRARCLLAQGTAAICAFVAVWLLRQSLTHGIVGPGIVRPELYGRIYEKVLLEGRPWDSTWGKFVFNVFMGFRWLWLLPVLGLLVPGGRSDRYILAASLVVMLIGSLSAATVADVSRSVGFLFPGLLLALSHLLRIRNFPRFHWTFALLMLQLFTPVFYHVGDWSGHCRPYPVEFVRLLTGIDPVDVVLRR